MSYKYSNDFFDNDDNDDIRSTSSFQSNDINDWNNNINISKDYIYQEDDYNEKKVNNLINEFIKLNDHLSSESKLFDELENGFYFSSEQKIIDFINNDLKVRI
jgi:hypothetical protein